MKGQLASETKISKDAKSILEFLDGTEAKIIMESGYNHEHIYDLLKEGCQGSSSTVGQGDRLCEGEERQGVSHSGS